MLKPANDKIQTQSEGAGRHGKRDQAHDEHDDDRLEESLDDECEHKAEA